MGELVLSEKLTEELKGEFNKILERVMDECNCSRLDALSIIVRKMYLIK